MGSGAETFATVKKLYEQGVFDYLSISLWRDYLNFVREHDPSVKEASPAGILKARDLFEQALTAAGMHVFEGCSKIWEAYREFEQAILLFLFWPRSSAHGVEVDSEQKWGIVAGVPPRGRGKGCSVRA